jgi:hypothetical protein
MPFKKKIKKQNPKKFVITIKVEITKENIEKLEAYHTLEEHLSRVLKRCNHFKFSRPKIKRVN